MTLFLIALAVGVVVAVVLWKLGQRTPPDRQERKPRPIADAVGHIFLMLIWLTLVGRNFRDAWMELGDGISRMRSADVGNLGVMAIQVQDARLRLVESTALTTALLIGLAYLIIRLIEVLKRHRSEAANKPQETHA